MSDDGITSGEIDTDGDATVRVKPHPDLDTTPPLGLMWTWSDRITTIEAKIDAEHAWVESLLHDRQDRDAEFRSRDIQSGNRVDSLQKWVIFFGGVTLGSLVVQGIRIVAVLALGK